MEKHIHILLAISFFFFFLITTLPQSNSQQYQTIFSQCSQPFTFTTLQNLSFPFWDDVDRPRYCGGRNEFKLNYDIGGYPLLQIDSQNFQVLDINITAYTMRIVRTDLAYDTCYPSLTNNSLSPALFQYTPKVYNMTLFYYCPHDVLFRSNFTCSNDENGKQYGFYVQDTRLQQFPELQKCEYSIQLHALTPLKHGVGIDPLREALKGGFEVKYKIEDDVHEECKRCKESGGVCGRNVAGDAYQFSCYCADGSQASLKCSNNKSNHLNLRKVIIGVTAGIAVLLICIITYYFRCKSSTWKVKFWLTTKGDRDIEAFLKNNGAQTLKRYKFSDVKKMTNSFKDKLGEGGYGVVYKGKLHTDCLVAVKILNASKKNGADFINEVASISRTSHINVVNLLGFCFEGNKKALIYEFMPNGSLDKFIHKNGPETAPTLSMENLYQIAKGIARGLEYLHKGCNTRILHFDIKPHNILLDENLCPKISDFGLAKLCPKKESIISVSEARGTIGYVAPEVWNRHFGGVSHKSDVYSYGMMLLEMVGETKNLNAEAGRSSEYFPDMIYKKLEMNSGFGHDGVLVTEEDEIAKKMTVVGLWCIQTFPNDRPTISKVIEMLEGGMNSLEVPPKPVSSSPPRSIPECSTTLSSTTSD